MSRIELLGALTSAVVVAAACQPSAWGQSGSSGGSASSGGSSGSSSGSRSGASSGGDPTQVPAAVSSGWNWYQPYVIVRATPDGVQSSLHVPFGAMMPAPIVIAPSNGTTLPPPPPGLFRPAARERPSVRISKADREKAERYSTFGDRMFRVGNFKRAEERYEQAIRANPRWAEPRVRLSQIALVREQYPLAADLLREAETAEPGWVVTAGDVQALYAEPAEFAKHVARLEAHLHKHPEDRDAWLLLGAQWFLSRRETRAADVFLRLDDPRRKPDVALAAFLDAARLRKDGPPPPPEPALKADESPPPAP